MNVSDEVPASTALRSDMVRDLRANMVVTSPQVVAALATVPRHLFAPGIPLRLAYAPERVLLPRRDLNGVVTSTMSKARVQAAMLEQAELRPGMRVLEIGSGGYNAALIAEIVGRAGEVTTVDIDGEVILRARGCLDAAGYQHVRTVVADAHDGVPAFAPYDRIVVTAQARDIPPRWIEQLEPDGQIVVPLRLLGQTASVRLCRVRGEPEHLVGGDPQRCAFVPMRGSDTSERVIHLAGGRVNLTLDHDAPLDPGRLHAALREQVLESWPGIAADQPGSLDLWLAAAMMPRPAVLTARQGLAHRHMLGNASWFGAPVLVSDDGSSFAYRMIRSRHPEGGLEVGFRVYGLAGAERLSTRFEQLLWQWHAQTERGTDIRFTIQPAHTADRHLPVGTVVDREHTRIVVGWP